MKTIKLLTILFFAVLNLNVAFGQSNNETMKKPNVKVQIKTKINAPADKVWEILGHQFANISEWTSVVVTSKALTANEIPEGSYQPAESASVPARQTTSINKGKSATLTEVVTAYSDEHRELTFYGVGLPSFIAYASDKQSVISTGENECEVVFNVEIRLKGIFKLFKGAAKKRFAANFKKVQNDLKIYAETGKVSQ